MTIAFLSAWLLGCLIADGMVELREGVKVLFGEKSASFASAESDIGLMLKMTGDMDGAIERYTNVSVLYVLCGNRLIA